MEMLSNILIQYGYALPRTCEMLSLSFVFLRMRRAAQRTPAQARQRRRVLGLRWRLLLRWLARRRRRVL